MSDDWLMALVSKLPHAEFLDGIVVALAVIAGLYLIGSAL